MRKLYYNLFAIILLILTSSTFGQNIYINARTKAYGGEHAPLSAAVIWVQTPEGKYIFTPHLWGRNVSFNLKTWRDVTGLEEFGFFDGVSSATRENHDSALVTSWDCKDTSGALVENGTYEIWLEMTSDDYIWSEGGEFQGTNTKTTFVLDFENDVDPVRLLGPTTKGITELSTKYFPKESAINYNIQNKMTGKGVTLHYNRHTGSLTIELDKSAPDNGVFQIFTTKGMLVKSIPFHSQTRTVCWNGRYDNGGKMASGIYFLFVNNKDFKIACPIFPISIF